jgi:hypothetical protein
MKKSKTQYRVEAIEARYDGEHDIAPLKSGVPTVNWTDMELLVIIKELREQVAELQETVMVIQANAQYKPSRYGG